MDFNAQQYEPHQAMDPIPSGWYPGIITEAKLEANSRNTGTLFIYTLQVMDGPYKGRKVVDNLNYEHQNTVAMEIGRKMLSAICHATGVYQLQDPSQICNRPLMFKVSLRPAGPGGDGQHYDASNDVKGFKAMDANSMVQQPQQPIAPPAQATPPAQPQTQWQSPAQSQPPAQAQWQPPVQQPPAQTQPPAQQDWTQPPVQQPPVQQPPVQTQPQVQQEQPPANAGNAQTPPWMQGQQ